MQGSIDSEFILNPGSLAGFRLLTGISNTGNLPTGPQAVFLRSSLPGPPWPIAAPARRAGWLPSPNLVKITFFLWCGL